VGNCVAAKVWVYLFPKREAVLEGSMALILLPDDCVLPCLPNKATKRRRAEVEVARPQKVTKSTSQTSLSSGSSNISKASELSASSSKYASSMCSFAPVEPASLDSNGDIRIAVGGIW